MTDEVGKRRHEKCDQQVPIHTCTAQPADTAPPLVGWRHHVHSISTRNSAQMILSNFYICKLNYFDIPCNISLKEHLPEDGHNRLPKHVGYVVYNTGLFEIIVGGLTTCHTQYT